MSSHQECRKRGGDDPGEVRLILGDCLEVLPTLPDASVDAVVADPPYNVGCRYSAHDDRRPDTEYETWCAAWYAECRRIARRVVIFPGHGNLGMWHRIAKPSGIGCWYKPGNPVSGGIFQWCEWEPWLLYGPRIGRSDVIRATITKQADVGNHPCPKPLALIIELVNRLKAGSVLDPFMGSGTTGVACMMTGRHFVGIEIDEGYYAITTRRIRAEQARYPLFSETSRAVMA